MGAEKLNKKRSGALVGGIFLILAVPVCGIQVPVQAFFFLAWIYVILFLEANSYSWNELQEAMVHSCTRAVSPIFFLLCAGAMTGIWNLSGTIPGLTYTGILWIRPEWYPVTAYAGCFLFSFLTGSVFSSCGTMGILFLNIGTSMGYEEKIAAAVIIAGAFCGYGISPMSDFVNLLSSSVEIELAKTLKAERNSIIPTICVCLAGCFYAGWKNAELAGISIQESSKMMQIFGEMCLGMPVYIPAAVVLIFMLMRKNAMHALMAGCVSGMAVAFVQSPKSYSLILRQGAHRRTSHDCIHRFRLNRRRGSLSLLHSLFLSNPIPARSKNMHFLLPGILHYPPFPRPQSPLKLQFHPNTFRCPY